MEIIAGIIVVIIAIYGFASLFNDASKGGLAALIIDVALVFVLALFE